MKKLTTIYLKENPTGTACGRVGNKSLSDPNVIDIIDLYYGGEIFVNKNYESEEIYEIEAKECDIITKEELVHLCNEDKNLKSLLKEYFDCKIKKIEVEGNESLLMGMILGFYIESAQGSARYDSTTDGVSYFEVE